MTTERKLWRCVERLDLYGFEGDGDVAEVRIRWVTHKNQSFQLSFNPRLRIEFQGSRVTSDGGLLLVRELDERLGLSDLIAQHVIDPRGKNTQFPLADLVC